MNFGLQPLSTRSFFTRLFCLDHPCFKVMPKYFNMLNASSRAPPKTQEYKDHKGFKGSCHFSSMMLSNSFNPIILDSVVAQEYQELLTIVTPYLSRVPSLHQIIYDLIISFKSARTIKPWSVGQRTSLRASSSSRRLHGLLPHTNDMFIGFIACQGPYKVIIII